MEARACDVCGINTREGKPYCPKHIERAPYLMRIQAELQTMAEDEGRLSSGLKVPLTATIMQEIIGTLREFGSITEERLAKERQLGQRAATNALDRLVKLRLAKRSVSKRGSAVYTWSAADQSGAA